jgi:hypothetical protein
VDVVISTYKQRKGLLELGDLLFSEGIGLYQEMGSVMKSYRDHVGAVERGASKAAAQGGE